ncbi:nonsense-mediated mRNA decay factor SMG7-like isoform X2 [Rhodnius prolixus]|uniref:Putative nonsense-mediated mrna decay protein n=1 Tax=Rhodnius neglectus TaxID=72488 RepID=A0A0P4VJ90_9HEMI
MVSRVAVEALKKADDLKEKAINLQNVELTIDIWPVQKHLQQIYHEVLILDLEYALDKKVEQDLWNYCFKNYIVALQNYAKDKKHNGIQVQSRLSWFLDCASGFYLSLLQEICSVFNLDLPFMRHDSLFGCKKYKENLVINKPERNSCYYICQHCLVHLGDVARYRNQMIQAESFYRHAVALGASSGHPYNQLALLEASRCDRLSTVFYYTRSIAVSHKFPAAITNLANTLLKCTKAELPPEGGKMVVSEYESAFLQLHALLYLTQDIPGAMKLLQSLTHCLTPLIATQEFSSWKLVQMVVITIFMFNQTEGKSVEVKKVLSEYITGFLNALFVPLYTVTGESVLDYFGLPAVKVLLSWLKCEPNVVNMLNRPHLWRGICKLLNSLRASYSVTPINSINSALPEDNDLRGFLPLEPVLSTLKFGGEKVSEDAAKKLRAFRIIKFGEWLASNCECKPIYISESGLFEVAQFYHSVPVSSDVSNNSKTTNSTGGGFYDSWKTRSRQNVALQSLLNRTNFQEKESENSGNVEWQENKSPVDWWPPGSSRDEISTWTGMNTNVSFSSQEGTYSLFSGNDPQTFSSMLQSSTNPVIGHQSLWSGPGPSPLERLLEQQKQLRNSSSQNDT